MDDITSFNATKRETINPMMDEINKQVEPLLKVAMKELGYELPLYVRVYNQIRFYEEYGKLKMGTSVASKESLAKQFGVTVKQIEATFNNLTNKYKLGKWVEHTEPVFRSVKRTWMSNERLKNSDNNYYSVIPELLQRNSTTITVEQLASEVRPLSESKKKVRESNNVYKYTLAKADGKQYGNEQINSMFEYWQSSTGIPITSRRQANRNACSNLIKKHGTANLERLIDGVALAQGDKYAPTIADFADLQSKYNQLILWGKKQTSGTVEVIS